MNYLVILAILLGCTTIHANKQSDKAKHEREVRKHKREQERKHKAEQERKHKAEQERKHKADLARKHGHKK